MSNSVRDRLNEFLVYKIIARFISVILSYQHAMLVHLKFSITELIQDHLEDKRLNINTGPAPLFLTWEQQYRNGVFYSPTPYKDIKKIINYLNLTPGDIFIDIGCGKGRVIFLVGTQKVKKVIGIELKQELLDICHKNLSKLKINVSPIQIIEGNVTGFQFREGTIFFLFHPFGVKSTLMVMDNIKKSIMANPRKIRIVFKNPIPVEHMKQLDWLESEGRIEDTDVSVFVPKSFFFKRNN